MPAAISVKSSGSAPITRRRVRIRVARHKKMSILRKQLFDSTRGRIVTSLRSGGLTADDLASKLRLTPTAVRAHITSMERDGLVRRSGQRRGTTRPFQVFELKPEVEQLLSSAYIPLLTQLVDVFADGLPARQLETMLREAGRRLADEVSRAKRPAGTLAARVAAVSEMLNEQLGAMTHVDGNGDYVIRGIGCPLAALTGKHPGVCLAMESLVAEVVGAPVHECCDRTERPQCCFEISGSTRGRRALHKRTRHGENVGRSRA
jgi:DeoR family transcriptional regulator, suf operon transcriptional repressor